MNGSFTPAVVRLIRARDQDRCFRCGTFLWDMARGWDWSIHHRRPRGSGGTSLEWVGYASNGVILCGSATTGCHQWVESHRSDATAQGYLVSINGVGRPGKIPVQRLDGTRWLLTDTGGIEQLYGVGDDIEVNA